MNLTFNGMNFDELVAMRNELNKALETYHQQKRGEYESKLIKLIEEINSAGFVICYHGDELFHGDEIGVDDVYVDLDY